MKKPAKRSEIPGRLADVVIHRFSADSIPVLVTSVLFVIASGFLFFSVDRELDPDLNKNWWTVSFDSRASDSTDFTVENHSLSDRFTYIVTRNRETVDAGELSVARGARKTVSPIVPVLPGRTTVSVSSSDGTKKEIYRER